MSNWLKHCAFGVIGGDWAGSEFGLQMLTLSVRYFGMESTWPGQRPVVLVGHMATDVSLEVLEKDEPPFA